MLSIKNNYQTELVVKNSKFIALICRVDTKSDIDNFIEKVKKMYPNATHYCYGYVLDNIARSSDDKEPSKTAGIPILNQITGRGLNHTLIVVVRYFGGVKLGTGLLTRTYAKVAREVINDDNIISLEKGYLVVLQFDYSRIKEIDYLLEGSNIIKKKFDDVITYEAIITRQLYDRLSDYVVKKEEAYTTKDLDK